MITGADKLGSLVTTDCDSRVTDIGRFLRKYRLDELPQIFNVLSGSMSIVGTRPEVQHYVDMYEPKYFATLLMPAGITSLASIMYKDEEKLLKGEMNVDRVYVEKILPEKMKFNLSYVKNTMQAMLANSKQITYLEHNVSIMSSIKPNNKEEIELMAKELCKDYVVHLNKNDMNALFKIGYGLYVVTSNDGKQNNGLIVNTVTQVSDNPNRIAVNINKANYSYHVIKQTGILNVNCLTVDAPFKVFENFGFQSGRNTDKFVNYPYILSDNGLPILTNYINASISLKVENYIDLDSHGMFICSVTEARVMNNKETMTYEYYQKNVKPKPDTDGKKGFVCKVCGYVYEGDVLPDDYICPLCKHGASDFEPIK